MIYLPAPILPVSLSPQQRHLWRLQLIDQPAPYSARCAILITGRLDVHLLVAALQQVVDQYEILRTSFQYLPGMSVPLQVIAERSDVVLPEHDLADQDAAAQVAAVAVLFADISLPLDLASAPLLRAALARLGPDRHLLLIGLPALCADATTLDHLMRAIGRAYAAATQGANLLDEPMQYADVVAWQNELLEAPETVAGRAYWQQLDLAAIGTARLPFEPADAAPAGFAPPTTTDDRRPTTDHGWMRPPVSLSTTSCSQASGRICCSLRRTTRS